MLAVRLYNIITLVPRTLVHAYVRTFLHYCMTAFLQYHCFTFCCVALLQTSNTIRFHIITRFVIALLHVQQYIIAFCVVPRMPSYMLTSHSFLHVLRHCNINELNYCFIAKLRADTTERRLAQERGLEPVRRQAHECMGEGSSLGWPSNAFTKPTAVEFRSGSDDDAVSTKRRPSVV